MSDAIRVGVDVGGTFTKAVALTTRPFRLLASAVEPTTHDAEGGVADGVAAALKRLLSDLGGDAAHVELVAFSTTQAMNALLEGDVARVGVIGIGVSPDLRPARKRTRVGSIKLASKRVLETRHVFIDATGGLGEDQVDAALDHVVAEGCTAVAVSGAFAVDSPEHETMVSESARARGLPACAGNELTGQYGLETRTVSAAVNASILPVVERTAALVEAVLAEAGVGAPLLVLRGDGGSMGVEAFRRSPSLTIGSGPAAGVAAALHGLELREALVLECGGTSSNVSIVKHGRTALRTLRVMGRPTAIRSVDSWVVGAAGGSMARLGRRAVEEAGPRSAHVAGLEYACYADPSVFADARVERVAPRAGDPEQYAVVVTAAGERYALTATCAAYACDAVDPEAPGLHSGAPEAARAAFAVLGRTIRRDGQAAARDLLDRTVDKIARAVADAARAHDFPCEVPVVALGGSGTALVPSVAERLGRPYLRPEHPEVLSSIGAALSLVRAERVRHGAGAGAAVRLAQEAERACVDAGAAAQTVRVETRFEHETGLLRAVATGAVALESGAAAREPVDEEAQLRAAADALALDPGRLGLVARNDFYGVWCENGSGGVAVVDESGSVALAEQARRVIATGSADLLPDLEVALDENTVNLGVAALLPRVAVMCGPRIVDLSDSRRADEVLDGARAAVEGHDGPAVAVIWQ